MTILLSFLFIIPSAPAAQRGQGPGVHHYVSWMPIDSVHAREVRPGIIHTAYTLTGPLTLDVLAVELDHREYALTSFRPDSLTPTRQQVRLVAESGVDVIGAINADFFSFTTQWPVGNQISEGVPVTGLRSDRSHVSISYEGYIRFGPASFSASLLVDAKTSVDISGLNAHATNGPVLLFTSFRGESTRTPAAMTDVSLRRISDVWNIGDTTSFVVASIDTGGNALLHDADAVLAFSDGYVDIGISDTIRIIVSYGLHTGNIRTLLGGAGKILVDGALPDEGDRIAENIGEKFVSERHPRTFIAIDKDTSTFYFCTVDGRQASSIGMNFAEMGKFLLWIGAWNAINLDGGGSTTMVIDGEIVNAPSDRTGERPVANTMMVVQER